MSEIRKHYFLPEYCIIAEERAKRPSDFVNAAEEPEKNSTASCSFCGGAEGSTPLAAAVYKNGKIFADTPEKRVTNWDFRCFPNLYPALSPVPGTEPHREKGLKAYGGYGFHEVIIESPLHGRRLEDFSDRELRGLMDVYRDRTCSYLTSKKILYVSLFKNSGKRAGASLNHAHSQLIAIPFFPALLEREINAVRESDKCPYCSIFNMEKSSSRLIFENNECIAFAPYYSMGPFEVWILPRRHVNFLGNCDKELLFALGDILRSVLKTYRKILGNVPYNYMFYQLFNYPEYHLNLRVLPRLSTAAGFELNTGTYINTVSPEKAAEYLRGDLLSGK